MFDDIFLRVTVRIGRGDIKPRMWPVLKSCNPKKVVGQGVMGLKRKNYFIQAFNANGQQYVNSAATITTINVGGIHRTRARRICCQAL